MVRRWYIDKMGEGGQRHCTRGVIFEWDCGIVLWTKGIGVFWNKQTEAFEVLGPQARVPERKDGKIKEGT